MGLIGSLEERDPEAVLLSQERVAYVGGLVCFFSSLRASSSPGSEPFTQVYTMSIGNSGHRLRVRAFLTD